jgi:hypothetical protein
LSGDIANLFRPKISSRPTSYEQPKLAKYSLALGRWICPNEYKRILIVEEEEPQEQEIEEVEQSRHKYQ